MPKRLFHTPAPDGTFGTCTIEDLETGRCTRDPSEHQLIDVKGRARTYVLADEHGTHVIVEHELTPADEDHRQELLDAHHQPGCELEEFPADIWDQAVRRMNKENLARLPEGEPVTQEELVAWAKKLRTNTAAKKLRTNTAG